MAMRFGEHRRTCMLVAMTESDFLPDPWRLVETLPPAEQDVLEASVGSKLTYDDLTPDDIDSRDQMKLPKSRRSMYVMGHRWVRLQNVDTDGEVILRLQSSPERDGSIRVSSVIYPFEPARDLKGADLRALPIAALNAAFSKREQEGTARMHILLALGEETTDALDSLPRASASDRFSALVARQFLAIESAGESRNVAKAMAELNDVPLSTVQRWIARARKQAFLPPAMPKGHDA